MNGEARVSSALTSQLLHGEVVHLLESNGDWRRVAGPDGYEGWMHSGYLMACSGSEATWRLSLGCITRGVTGALRRLPLGARLSPSDEVVDGVVIPASDVAERFPRDIDAIAKSASSLFSGAPYVWGGVSPWGADCSGLVQRVFALHGVQLPRDAWQQAEASTRLTASTIDEHAPGDLFFFSDRDDKRITHVAVALSERRFVHSALGRGGVAVERLDDADVYIGRLRSQWIATNRVAI